MLTQLLSITFVKSPGAKTSRIEYYHSFTSKESKMSLKNFKEIPSQSVVQITSNRDKVVAIPIDMPYKDNTGSEYLHIKFQVENFKSDVQLSEQSSIKLTPIYSFKCNVCGKVYATKSHLQRHLNVHQKKKDFLCDLCHIKCADNSSLRRHRISHTGEKPHVCAICLKSFGLSSSLRRHLTLHNPQTRAHSCSECGKRFPDKCALAKHARLHSGTKSYVCSVCSKAFYHVGDLNLHVKCHTSDKPFNCDRCGKKFSRRNNLARHKEVHSGTSINKCDECGVNFQHVGTLTRHVLACHPVKKEVKMIMAGPCANLTLNSGRQDD